MVYEGDVDLAQVKFDPVEIESIQYLSMDELKEMLDQESAKLCGWFIELLNLYLHGKGKMEIMK